MKTHPLTTPTNSNAHINAQIERQNKMPKNSAFNSFQRKWQNQISNYSNESTVIIWENVQGNGHTAETEHTKRTVDKRSLSVGETDHGGHWLHHPSPRAVSNVRDFRSKLPRRPCESRNVDFVPSNPESPPTQERVDHLENRDRRVPITLLLRGHRRVLSDSKPIGQPSITANLPLGLALRSFFSCPLLLFGSAGAPGSFHLLHLFKCGWYRTDFSAVFTKRFHLLRYRAAARGGAESCWNTLGCHHLVTERNGRCWGPCSSRGDQHWGAKLNCTIAVSAKW